MGKVFDDGYNHNEFSQWKVEAMYMILMDRGIIMHKAIHQLASGFHLNFKLVYADKDQFFVCKTFRV